MALACQPGPSEEGELCAAAGVGIRARVGRIARREARRTLAMK